MHLPLSIEVKSHGQFTTNKQVLLQVVRRYAAAPLIKRQGFQSERCSNNLLELPAKPAIQR
ncbi:hypothetical protein PC358_05900 [Pseudomonas capeferrum]|nr:hypothetical protein PC358_05900 [Pseudomonas capeferrum]